MAWWHWLVILAAWAVGSLGSAAALAWLYRRLHPSLAFYKLWAFWTMVVSLIAAAVLAFG